jgi:hypothetical protein
MKTSLILLLVLPLSLLAQNSGERYRHRADSMVAYFLGSYIFQHYVQREDQKSSDVAPNAFHFEYELRHPKFSHHVLAIALTLDSTGQFSPRKETDGIIRIEPGSDSNWVTASEALRICRDQARRIKRRSLRLAWDSTSVSYRVFHETKNFRDIIPGNLVWHVKGEVLFRGDRYRGVFEVNVFTGAVARRFAIPWD